ncbi:hypothetical protein DL98DRAFT_518360 [Cadophora sp. DSE1049]|nr:hypothetical protein DL98DRAFT_518360 [Cadophora sp. DSE1049]
MDVPRHDFYTAHGEHLACSRPCLLLSTALHNSLANIATGTRKASYVRVSVDHQLVWRGETQPDYVSVRHSS